MLTRILVKIWVKPENLKNLALSSGLPQACFFASGHQNPRSPAIPPRHAGHAPTLNALVAEDWAGVFCGRSSHELGRISQVVDTEPFGVG